MPEDKLGDLVYRFFEAFKCNVKWNDGVLHIENVPKDFEKFFGKRSPYYFSFDPKLKKGELITKASYLIKIINDYMDNKAETTLLKINFEPNLKNEIQSKFLLRNCKISSLSKKEEMEFFIRFTFLTTIQYLNEKEQITTSIYLSNNKIINLNDSSFNLIDGKKRDISKILNIEEQIESNYDIAKGKVQKISKPDIQKITDSLNEKLNKEIDRINKHLNKEISEIEKRLDKHQEKIRKLQTKYEKTGDKSILEKRNKIEEKVFEIHNSTDLKKLKKDQELLIQNEIRKHGINIKNKIINTSIIYYPIFKLQIFFKTPKAGKIMEIFYDPLEKEFSEIKCESCNKKVEEIIICSSGHLTCKDCGKFCEGCNEVVCDKCQNTVCPECSKIVCSKCVDRCLVCGKTKCLDHFPSSSDNHVCNKCLVTCFNCGKGFRKEFMKTDEYGRSTCQKCYTKNVGRDIMNDI